MSVLYDDVQMDHLNNLKSGHLAIFSLLWRTVMMLLKSSFFSLIFFSSLIANRDMQLKNFYQVETLLNNAFN